ncbi:HD domain-containing protein [Candidatus Cyanaurora vandensis]|uniref:HD domain-containing protein n=1 Tax=Candidatus Cyanaurora vandensis TaxID=2714958 RepID=UPI00257EC1AF|nr:HD domain-containing protein [Candidatus Cyanaurora vandensis]
MLTERYQEALVLAFRLHQHQQRKGGGPYISHLLTVSALILEDGGNENEAIAALLHDAVEDQGGQPTLALIRDKFGDEVAAIVASCTESDCTPKPPWKDRKLLYLAHLQAGTPAVARVSLADKFHNATTLLSALRAQGAGVWERFKGGREDTLWFYRELLAIYREVLPASSRVAELERVVIELQTTPT